jgi:predicted RNase H-like HicB family nuclease
VPRRRVAVVTDYVVKFEWDGEVWVASAPEVKGAHTQARTLSSARARIREAIALMEDLEDEDAFGIVEEVSLPANADKALREAKDARRAADESAAVAEHARTRAVAVLSEVNLSTRDVGELVELSHSRVHQLLVGVVGGPAAAAGVVGVGAVAAGVVAAIAASGVDAARSAIKHAPVGGGNVSSPKEGEVVTRSGSSGRFVSKSTAHRAPRTTVTEPATRRKRAKG